MNHISLLSSAEARRLWECLMDPPPVHVLWDNLITLLCDLFSVERTNLFLVIPEKEQLRSRAATMFEWDIVLPWREGIAGKVFQERQPLLIHDIPASEFGHYFNQDSTTFQTRSMLTVPVFRDGDDNQAIVAIIQLVNKLDKEFLDQDIEALKYWSRQIGVAIERTHGTEIWRHPESEPPALETPEFDPVLPPLSCRQAVLALPGFTNMIISELSNSHTKLHNFSWSEKFWAKGEMIKLLRNGHHHAHIVHQLSGELSKEEKRLTLLHPYFLRMVRWVGALTRNDLLYHMIAMYEEWLAFFCSSFSHWLCRSMTKERNILHKFVEDKRSHCTFYESMLLDYLVHHPHRRAEFHILNFFLRPIYSYVTKRLLKTMAHVSNCKALPQHFAKTFQSFTDHRTRALMECAEARHPRSSQVFQRFFDDIFGWASIGLHCSLGLLTLPLALLWPLQTLPAIDEEVPSTLAPKPAGG